jgi:uncharacterized protein
MRSQVEFWSGGRRRPGLLHRPPGAVPPGTRAAVVLAHGLANDREEAGQFGPLTDRLVAEGHVVLRFDFRGGVRDVDPGRQLPASEWPHDLISAVAFARGLPDVDAARVGVVGSSCGGSVALVVAAVEPAVRYVVTLGCFADGADWLRGLWCRARGDEGWCRFLGDLAADRARRASGDRSRRVPLAGGFLPVAESDLESIAQLLEANPGMLGELALETADDLLLLSPEAFAGRGEAPVLLVHGSADSLVPASDADRLERALGPRVTRIDVDGGPHQLLLGQQRDDVLDLVAGWIGSQ